MNKEEVSKKLNKVLNRLGMDTTAWIETISYFQTKLELLSEANNYSKLLKSLFASNDLSEFNSYVFEAMFAYDFESNHQSLAYEVSQLSTENSSVDFCYKLKKFKILFELRLIQQRNWITKSVAKQLEVKKIYETLLSGKDEADETVRLQNLILQKCQNADGKPIKFYVTENDLLNFIVINISELHLSMIDKADCFLSMYGDISVPPYFRRGIFGMWQDLHENSSEIERKYYNKFQHFRETIHGVLFVRYVRGSGYINRLYIDRELEYFAILNNNLVPKETADFVLRELASFLPEWSNKNSKKIR